MQREPNYRFPNAFRRHQSPTEGLAVASPFLLLRILLLLPNILDSKKQQLRKSKALFLFWSCFWNCFDAWFFSSIKNMLCCFIFLLLFKPFYLASGGDVGYAFLLHVNSCLYCALPLPFPPTFGRGHKGTGLYNIPWSRMSSLLPD